MYDHRTEVVDCFDDSDIHLKFGARQHLGYGARLLRVDNAQPDMIQAVCPSSLVVFGWRLWNLSMVVAFPPTRWAVLGASLTDISRATSPPLTKATFVFGSAPICPKGLLSEWVGLKELVLAFPPGGVDHKLDAHIAWTLDELVPCFEGERVVRVTFVNPASVHLDTYGEVSRMAMKLSGGEKGGPTLKDYVDIVRHVHNLGDDKLRSLSLEEYELEVGTETFKLETDPTFVLR
jgi:hypothetical protein